MIDYLRSRFDFWTIASIFIFIVIVTLCIEEWLSGKRDGPFEEMAEDLIESQIGLEIDLTADSVETGHLP